MIGVYPSDHTMCLSLVPRPGSIEVSACPGGGGALASVARLTSRMALVLTKAVLGRERRSQDFRLCPDWVDR